MSKTITSRNQNINLYLNEIRKAEILTQDEEKRLFALASAGDQSAKDKIFKSLSKYAFSVANKYATNEDMLEDLVQEANIGILEAMEKFDPSKGVRFISFAVFYMKAGIEKYLDQNDSVRTKTPTIIDKVKKIKNKFYCENNREATDVEVMDILEEQGISIMSSDMSKARIESLDDITITGKGEVEYNSELAKIAVEIGSHNDYLDEVKADGDKEDVEKCMSILDNREKKMVTLFFGLGDLSPVDYETIAEREEGETGKHITSERVRQIVTGAVKKMQAKANE